MSLHIERMGFKTFDDYRRWCDSNNISSSLEKSATRLNQEYKLITSQRACNILRRTQLKKFKTVINEIRNNAAENSFFDKVHRDIAKRYKDIQTTYYKEYADTFLDVLLFLEDNSKLVSTIEYIRSLENVVLSKDFWIRPFNEWVPKSHNIHNSSLLLLDI